MPILRLTASILRDLSPDAIYWDEELPGFGFLVRSSGHRSWIVQRAVRGRTRRVKVGTYPTWTLAQARSKAKELLVQLESGVDVNAEKRAERARGVTLQEAMDAHLRAMEARGRASRSREDVKEEIERHLSDWLGRELVSIRKADCIARHARITEKSGPYAANHAFRAFRSCWNTAARQSDDESFPVCPTRAVVFNQERRRQAPVANLAAWRAEVERVQNPIRRALLLFLLYTGLRSTDAKTVKWQHVDLEKGTLFRPKPKGGEKRAFVVPMAKAAIDLLRELQAVTEKLYPGCPLVFPAVDRDGKVTHVRETKVQRVVGGKKVAALPSAHRLRDTFASAGHAAGVDITTLACLMNHRMPAGSVTAGYINPTVGTTLRDAVERIAAWLQAAMQRSAAVAS